MYTNVNFCEKSYVVYFKAQSENFTYPLCNIYFVIFSAQTDTGIATSFPHEVLSLAVSSTHTEMIWIIDSQGFVLWVTTDLVGVKRP